MKTLRFSFASLALALASLPTLASETAPRDADTRERPRMRALGQLRTGERAKLAERLGLTAEQREQLKAKRAGTAAAAKAIRADTTLTREQKRAQLKETWKTAQSELRAILTPEQQTKLTRMKQRAHRIAHRRTRL